MADRDLPRVLRRRPLDRRSQSRRSGGSETCATGRRSRWASRSRLPSCRVSRVPGSRSQPARFLKLDRDAAARLSFLLLVPDRARRGPVQGRDGRAVRRPAAGLGWPLPGRHARSRRSRARSRSTSCSDTCGATTTRCSWSTDWRSRSSSWALIVSGAIGRNLLSSFDAVQPTRAGRRGGRRRRPGSDCRRAHRRNGLSATAVLLPAGLLYVTAAWVYRLPVPVQPLKAFGAIAIAKGLGSDEIAAGALLMGVIFLSLGRLGLLDLAARTFPRPLIRGVQLTVGLLFLKIAWDLVTDPPKSFSEHALSAELGSAARAPNRRTGLRAARLPDHARSGRGRSDRDGRPRRGRGGVRPLALSLCQASTRPPSRLRSRFSSCRRFRSPLPTRASQQRTRPRSISATRAVAYVQAAWRRRSVPRTSLPGLFRGCRFATAPGA